MIKNYTLFHTSLSLSCRFLKSFKVLHTTHPVAIFFGSLSFSSQDTQMTNIGIFSSSVLFLKRKIKDMCKGSIFWHQNSTAIIFI